MERAIILAAGKGERLVNGRPYPKPLHDVGGLPLIVRVLRSLERAGVDEAVVVVGYLGDVLVSALQDYRFDLRLRFVRNDEFDKPNGTSLLKAKHLVEGPTYVLMSDHLWAPELLEAVRRYPLGADEAVLGVDFEIAACPDLDDATKVALCGDRVMEIGKGLARYDALDTGVFRVTGALIRALEEADDPVEGCSLSQGVARLAAEGRMRVVDVEGARWIDVDTPAMHTQAERLLRRYGPTLAPRARRAVAALSAE